MQARKEKNIIKNSYALEIFFSRNSNILIPLLDRALKLSINIEKALRIYTLIPFSDCKRPR